MILDDVERASQQYFFTILLLAISMIILVVSFYSIRMSYRIAEVHGPLMQEALEVELELTKAHLLFEELISGEYEHTLGDVFTHTKKAKTYIQTMIIKSQSTLGEYISFDSTPIQDALYQMNLSIVRLESLIELRLIDSSLGSEAGKIFHQDYNILLQNAERIKVDMMARTTEERNTQKTTNYITFTLFSFMLFYVLCFDFMRRRREIKLLGRLKFQATHDELTTMPNRRKFNHVYKEEWNRARRAKSSLALCMCDIDFFKAYNDTLGHQAGDDCLQAVAKFMKNTLKREIDCVARYGGEEFVFILPTTEQKGAKWLMEKLHKALAEAKIPHPSSEVSKFVTLSIGVAASFPQGTNKDDLLKDADNAMYQAKVQGRNKTVLA